MMTYLVLALYALLFLLATLAMEGLDDISN
jgi:hypothetical protein